MEVFEFRSPLFIQPEIINLNVTSILQAVKESTDSGRIYLGFLSSISPLDGSHGFTVPEITNIRIGETTKLQEITEISGGRTSTIKCQSSQFLENVLT